ncbi:MAG: hypothetical protein MUF11_02265, partial [Beijerinckiaceae bacterium]|nr:hypothetical protein [Beijerinckiaceae bacterium]
MKWAAELPGLTFVTDITEADGILLMGLPDDDVGDSTLVPLLAGARARNLPMFCSNPDKASPRQGDRLVRSPGKLAEDYAE